LSSAAAVSWRRFWRAYLDFTVSADRYVEQEITLGIGGPAYDLTPMRNLIPWRDRYRTEHAG
jgi:hypothetical protein